MTAALVSAVNDLDLPAEPGVSRHAVRTVLKVYCKIAQHDGSFRYGLRGSKIAALADLSLSTIRRAQRYLVAHGFLEKIQIGGGRASTRWRIILDKLGIRRGSRPAGTPQPDHRDTAQEREPKRLGKMFSRWRPDRDHGSPGRPPPQPETSPASRAAVAASPPGDPAASTLDWAAQADLTFDTCEHGGRAGRAPSGILWCPSCRRQETAATGT